MIPPIRTLPDLFFDQLRDLHSAEAQVAETLPHLLELAELPALQAHFEEQLELTLNQKRRLASVFSAHQRELHEDLCQAMQGLIAGGNAHLEQVRKEPIRDLMLVAHWMRIKHYLIAAYQVASTLALQIDSLVEREALSELLATEERALKALEAVAGELFEGCRAA